MFRFEKLDVWQEAVDLSTSVYQVSRSFPDDERFGLTSQIRRSSVSVAANIAEGSGRSSDREFTRFVEIAFGSLMETVSHLTIASRQSFVTNEAYNDLYTHCEKLGKMLSAFKKRLKSSQH